MKCLNCNSKEVIKHGRRKTHRGFIQRYKCKSCGYDFIKKDKYFRMKNSKYKIEKALKLLKEGYSLRQIKKKMRGISHTGIMRWNKKFTSD